VSRREESKLGHGVRKERRRKGCGAEEESSWFELLSCCTGATPIKCLEKWTFGFDTKIKFPKRTSHKSVRGIASALLPRFWLQTKSVLYTTQKVVSLILKFICIRIW